MNLATIIDPHPDKLTALVSRGDKVSYGELRRQVAKARGGLRKAGVGPGDRVAIVLANNPTFATTYFAVLGVGAVAVPLNPGSPAMEIERQLGAVGARVAVVGPAAKDAADRIDRSRTGLDAVVTPDSLTGRATADAVDRSDEDVAVLMFTAGTSGSPRAAMLTHGNLRINQEQVQAHPGRIVQPDDVMLGVLPLFHIFGLNVVLGLGLRAGASVVLVERFDPTSALETIQRHNVTIVAGAPTMYSAWVALGGANPGAFASVRLATSGAAPLPDDVPTAFESRFGVPLYEGYGLTEAAPVVTSSRVDVAPRIGSVGLPLPGVELRLVDEEGEDALVGDPGEIWVRGPNVFAGYWGDEAATAAVLDAEGWLHTGDIAVADDEGYLYIVDRAKDLVIVSGFNVYPAEVEEALLEHPGIAEVAVVGVPHPYSGEAVKAFVVNAPGHQLEEDDVIEFCADRLARYKCPTKVQFVSELPHGLGGKLLRRQLKPA